jgi:hypothetical protein
MDWISLLSCIEDLELSQKHDTFYWNLNPNGELLVKSYYITLKFSTTPNINRDTRKMNVPLKLIFYGMYEMEYFSQKIIWPNESLTCAFCHKEETINHLFFECRSVGLEYCIDGNWLQFNA